MSSLRNKNFLLGLCIAAGSAVLAPLTTYLTTQPTVTLVAAVLVRLLPLGLALAFRLRVPPLARGLVWGWLVLVAAPFVFVYLLVLTGGVMNY